MVETDLDWIEDSRYHDLIFEVRKLLACVNLSKCEISKETMEVKILELRRENLKNKNMIMTTQSYHNWKAKMQNLLTLQSGHLPTTTPHKSQIRKLTK